MPSIHVVKPAVGVFLVETSGIYIAREEAAATTESGNGYVVTILKNSFEAGRATTTARLVS